ncbi:MAG TPA: DNA gyrase modulator, partial [Marmoricola sp.]|nr:DNA gyrase modulator [Marmoricola sp.]
MRAPDSDFGPHQYDALCTAALDRARQLGADHADFRFERVRYQQLTARDGALQGAEDYVDSGFAVRVLRQGVWGFAATTELSVDAAIATAQRAVAVAQVAAPMSRERVGLAQEPPHQAVWVSDYEIDPFAVETA